MLNLIFIAVIALCTIGLSIFVLNSVVSFFLLLFLPKEKRRVSRAELFDVGMKAGKYALVVASIIGFYGCVEVVKNDMVPSWLPSPWQKSPWNDLVPFLWTYGLSFIVFYILLVRDYYKYK